VECASQCRCRCYFRERLCGRGRRLLSSTAWRYLERSDGLRDLEEEEEADDGEQVGDGEDQFADEVRVVLRPERSLEVHVVIVDDVHGRRRPADERRSEQHQHHVVVAIPHVTIVHLSAPATRGRRLIKPFGFYTARMSINVILL